MMPGPLRRNDALSYTRNFSHTHLRITHRVPASTFRPQLKLRGGLSRYVPHTHMGNNGKPEASAVLFLPVATF